MISWSLNDFYKTRKFQMVKQSNYVIPPTIMPVGIMVRKEHQEIGEKLKDLFLSWLFLNGVVIDDRSIDVSEITEKVEEVRRLTEGFSISMQLGTPSIPLERIRLVENVAKVIYEQWRGTPEFREWVEGGNSDKQEEARAIARIGLSSTGSAKPSWLEVDAAINGVPKPFPAIQEDPREVVVLVYGPPGAGVCNLSAYVGHLLKKAGYDVSVKSKPPRDPDAQLEDDPLFTDLSLEQVTNHVQSWGDKAPRYRIEAVTVPRTNLE